MIVLKLTPDVVCDYRNSIEHFFQRNIADKNFFHPHELSYPGLLNEIADNPKNYYVFFMDIDNVLGYGMLRGWQEGYEIPSLGILIDIAQRGKGISKNLMWHLESVAQIKKSPKIRLTVFKQNKNAIALYNKLGYIFSDKNENELVGIKIL
jgi:ribosomal protein S18 acetylase RimI-like enzyme